MRGLILIAFLSALTGILAQGTIAPIRAFTLVPRKDSTLQVHTAIQPFVRQLPDSVHVRTDGRQPGMFRITANPDFAAQYDTSLFYRAAAGISIETLVNDKFYARMMASAGWSTREGVNQTHTAFSPLNTNHQYWYTDVRARIGYTPNEMLHVSAGIDNQFFGEGARSLIQGDQTSPNPFAMMRVTAWRLEYGLLYQFFHENHASRNWKFGATHYLSYNVTRKWNIGLFETVLFQPKDGSFNRSFEVEYLNPIVFFRPQEYSLGSSDNVLLGFQTSLSVKKQLVYMQVSLDEFVIKEIRERSKWWANKYGFQLGVKGTIRKKYNYRVEGNIVRPYTYAHFNDGQNFGNQGNPLGHPLGSNFAELLAELRFTQNAWVWKGYGVFQLKGYDDSTTVSWGGDVYKDYSTRSKEYGNTIGQGITLRTVRIGVEIGRNIPLVRGIVYIDPQLAIQWGDLPSRIIPAINVGFRSQLFQERKLY